MKLPTDQEIKAMIFSMWLNHLNLELINILGCLASRMQIRCRTPKWNKAIHLQIKRMVREGNLRRQVFLPGRPYYTPS